MAKLPFYSHRWQENLWATSEIQPTNGIQFDFFPKFPCGFGTCLTALLFPPKKYLELSLEERAFHYILKMNLVLSCDLFFNSVLGIYCFNLPETSVSVSSLLCLCPGSEIFSLKMNSSDLFSIIY